MPNPYHVRLAISQYGDQFRAELFTEDLGDTNGDLLPAKWELFNDDFKSYLSMGGAGMPADTAAKVGQEIFSYMLGGGENNAKWKEVLVQANRQGRPVRLLIDATTDEVRDLPYGLLCDPHDDYYVLRRPEIQFVRIIRRCTPRLLNLHKPRLRMLLVAAEPKKLPAFDGPQRLWSLVRDLPSTVDVLVCASDGVQRLADLLAEPADQWRPEQFAAFCQTTREQLQAALQSADFDILHLLAHGFGGGVLLCDREGGRAEVTARELGKWCGTRELQMAFLQVCKASLTDGRGGFGGVAQQLLNPKCGNLAAVVASPYPVDAVQSQAAALAFYNAIAAGKPPDVALDRQLPETNLSWAFLELWVRPSALADTGTRGAFQFASPYKGLARFEERDAEIFFGRQAEIAELVNILQDEPVVAVVGDSGSGKSSLLHAGLTPCVRQQGLVERTGWRIVALTPGDQPARNLLAALRTGDDVSMTDRPAHEDWTSALQTALDAACGAERPLLILFNQFEEIFTLCRNEAERSAVAEALAQAAKKHRDHFRLILDMRSEYGSRVAALPGLTDLIKRPWVLKPPTAANVREIVASPATHHGYTFEGTLDDGDPDHAQSLLDRILNDPLLITESGKLADEGAAESSVATPLPLLEFALERLWLKAVDRGSQQFTHSDYDELGGLGGAIAKHAEDVFNSLPTRPEFHASNEPQPLAERLFTALVSSRDTVHTRRPRPRHDLEVETGNPELASELIDCLVGERLLTIRSAANDLSTVRVDIAHEVLINWPRFQSWLSVDADTRALKEEFQNDAEMWERGGAGRAPRSRQNLPNPAAQNGYLTWIERANPPLTAGQNAFVVALRKAARQRKLARQIVVSISVAVAVVMTVLVMKLETKNTKLTQRMAGLLVKELHGLVNLTAPEFRQRAIELGEYRRWALPELKKKRHPVQPNEGASEEKRIILGKQRANAAIMMFHLNEGPTAVEFLRIKKDPETLAQFVYRCNEYGVKPQKMLDQLNAAMERDHMSDQSICYGLLLALGEFDLEQLLSLDADLLQKLDEWYRSDPSSAIHSACGWLMREWDRGELVRKADQELVETTENGWFDPKREWFVLKISAANSSESNEADFLTFVIFPPGQFRMGSPENETKPAAYKRYETQHDVIIERPFALCDREVTKRQFQANGRSESPATLVSWSDARDYCRELRATVNVSNTEDARPTFRLPTEEEWEFACRADTTTAFSFGSDYDRFDMYGSDQGLHDVATLRPNIRGLFDMHGNVREWTDGWYGRYGETTKKVHRVTRGGGGSAIFLCRSAARGREKPDATAGNIGLRLCVDLPPAK